MKHCSKYSKAGVNHCGSNRNVCKAY